MPLLVHSGTAAIDLSVAQTYRDDISDVLMASLVVEPNLMGIVEVAEEFAAEQATWVEDALNPYKITPLNSIASLASSTTVQTASFSVSKNDAAILDIGYILMVDSQVGVAQAEQFEVITLNGQTVTVNRNFGGQTNSAGTFASYQSSTAGIMRIVNRPIYPNSDLGKDLTLARIAKNNYINRFALDVNIDSEQIARSRAGYVPGVRDELGYQFQQRLVELKRIMGNAFLYSKAPNTFQGTSPNMDYQTMIGLIAWLDGTANSTAVQATSGSVLSDSLINTMAMNIYRQGADSNIVAVGPNGAQKIGQLYTDRMRLDQSDTERGFFAQSFIPSMANRHYLINDLYFNDTSGTGLMAVLDMSRIRIKPFIGQFFYTITAPSFRDGDALRCLSKWTLEVRNSGTDAGYAHQIAQAMTF